MIGKTESRTSQASLIISFIAVVAVLRIGRDVLMPFALAVLLSFLLMPLVVRLQRHLGRIVAVLLVTATVFTTFAGVGWLVSLQVAELADELPVYKDNIHGRVSSIRDALDSVFEWASQTTDEISDKRSAKPAAGFTGEPATEFLEEFASMPAAESSIEIAPPVAKSGSPPASGTSFLETFLSASAGSLIALLGMAAVVIVFVIFILITYDDLRDRILKLVGTRRLNETTQALGDAAGRVSDYLLMQTIINVSHGLLVGTGLYFLGLPAPLFWGFSSALLRYVPYLGPILAAALPIGMALAVSDNWTLPLMTIGLFIVLEIFSNNVMEPLLYGRSTGLSPLAVVFAAVFWTWLWGGIGLVLSTPLTVCLVVLGKHVGQLNFLNTLLSNNPALDPKHRFYQRLLAKDREGALKIAETHLEGRSLEEVYDQVLLPALAMFERNRHRGELEEKREKFILEYVRDIIDQLDVAERKRWTPTNGNSPSHAASVRSQTSVNVMCLPARDEADELAGAMFAQLLERDGHRARCLPTAALAGEMMDLVEGEAMQIVCVSALPPLGVKHARYLCKRLRSRFEELNIVVGVWTTAISSQRIAERVRQDNLVQGVATLAAGRELVRQLALGIVLRSPAEAGAR